MGVPTAVLTSFSDEVKGTVYTGTGLCLRVTVRSRTVVGVRVSVGWLPVTTSVTARAMGVRVAVRSMEWWYVRVDEYFC